MLSAFRGWLKTVQIRMFHPRIYDELIHSEYNPDDYVEVDRPCDHKNTDKYYLMFGEEVCRGCGQWTGKVR